jgi:hypothetical protein
MKVDMSLRTTLVCVARISCAVIIVSALSASCWAQQPMRAVASDGDSDFGPVMRAYLGYLRNEQEVVDDRASRREITRAYYRRNSNRIHALRQIATRLVSESGNDYIPELEAVASDELRTLFENPPRLAGLRSNQVLGNKFRFIAQVRAGEVFYVFARLDPYEQAALMEKQHSDSPGPAGADASGSRNPNGQRVGQPSTTRPRRAVPR